MQGQKLQDYEVVEHQHKVNFFTYETLNKQTGSVVSPGDLEREVDFHFSLQRIPFPSYFARAGSSESVLFYEIIFPLFLYQSFSLLSVLFWCLWTIYFIRYVHSLPSLFSSQEMITSKDLLGFFGYPSDLLCFQNKLSHLWRLRVERTHSILMSEFLGE
jgi:hypothetical protein